MGLSNLEKMFEDWINSRNNRNNSLFNSTLNELANYNVDPKAKARRVYKLCIKRGRVKWAINIHKKYRLGYELDDSVTAAGLAIMSNMGKIK